MAEEALFKQPLGQGEKGYLDLMDFSITSPHP